MRTKDFIKIMNYNLDLIRLDFNSQMTELRKVLEKALEGNSKSAHPVNPVHEVHETPSIRKWERWTDEEEILFDKLRDRGMTYEKMQPYFPNRTLCAIKSHKSKREKSKAFRRRHKA